MPHEYRNSDRIVNQLRRNRRRIENWFEQREESLELIVRQSVGGNTFRAFGNMPQRPSLVFRSWALKTLEDEGVTATLSRVKSQLAFDKWHDEFCESLRQEWRERMRKPIPFGPSRKLPDLLLKAFVRWAGLTDKQRERLISVLHVSLDSMSLVGMRNCIEDPEIPKNATMKFVAGLTMYRQIQDRVREIADEAGVPAIYYDVLVWNLGR
jgi:hypothetical protein